MNMQYIKICETLLKQQFKGKYIVLMPTLKRDQINSIKLPIKETSKVNKLKKKKLEEKSMK